MKKQGFGKIVSVTSIAGDRGGMYSGVHYSSSKGGISSMMKSFASRGATDQINVNCVSPGVVETPMSKEENIPCEGIPLNRLGTSLEVAKAIYFLASENADYITGTTLDINGGQLMR